MPRFVFYSFDYDRDNARVQQVKNMGRVESQPLLNANKWEEVKAQGEQSIKRWIDANMKGKSCLVVLVGIRTAERSWVEYEIVKAWNDGLGVVGIRIHGLKDLSGAVSVKGASPFASVRVKGAPMSGIVSLHDPQGMDSRAVYATIENNIAKWVEDAIQLRSRY